MEIPRYAPREPGGGPPSIYIDRASHIDRFGASRCSPSHSSRFAPSSIPMSIPSRSIPEDDLAPPPLPPPQYIHDLGASFEPRHQHTSSLDSRGSWDSPSHSPDQDRPRFERKNSDTGTIRPMQKDEGYHSLNSTASAGSQPSLPRLFMSHDKFQHNQPAQSQYDNNLLKKLDNRRRFDNASPPRRSGLSASAGGLPSDRLRNQLPTLSLPTESGYASVESSPYPRDMPLRGNHLMPFSSAMSNDFRSPIEPPDVESYPFSRSPYYRTKRNNSGSQQSDDAITSTPNSAEHNTDEMDFAMEDASGIRRLQSDDYQSMASANKRRAVASPDGDIPMAMSDSPGGPVDVIKRRLGTPRGSPAPRLTVIPQGSTSSMSSTTGRGGSSYTSAMSLAGTSISSMASQSGRLSPRNWSPSGLSPIEVCHSPFNTSVGPSPRAGLARLSHQRQVSGSDSRSSASPRKVPDAAKANASKVPGGYFMCECCPKKPKKFETAEELHAHEAEKQYECSFCGNRFKNKNEAERHQNSLHVRRHSWSCSALLEHGYDHAFHESTNQPGEADVCGFCGDEFSRSGSAGRTRQATEQDWEARLRHLQEVHKFRECNSSKKFFRADHFRQHLKHSHAGTSGKWTNMLETACMLAEDPPLPRR